MGVRGPFATELPHDATLARVARRFTRGVLDDWGVPEDLADKVLLVTSELASNALLHARPPFLLNISTTGEAVRVSVHDGVGLTPALRNYSRLAVTGRGLRLVALTSDEWGVRAVGAGKEVWAEVSLTAAATAMSLAPMQPASSAVSGAPSPGVAGPGVAVPGSADIVDQLVVHFLGVPVGEYLRLQERNDAVFRECALLAASQSESEDIPQSLVALAKHISEHVAHSRDSNREVVALAHAQGQRTTDIHRTFDAEQAVAAVQAAESYLQITEELDGYCRLQVLLTEPPSDAIVQIRRWFVTEMRSQLIDGADPRPFLP